MHSYRIITYLLLIFQYINTTGARVCVKELYETKYDALSVSYTVLSGGDAIWNSSFRAKERFYLIH